MSEGYKYPSVFAFTAVELLLTVSIISSSVTTKRLHLPAFKIASRTHSTLQLSLLTVPSTYLSTTKITTMSAPAAAPAALPPSINDLLSRNKSTYLNSVSFPKLSEFAHPPTVLIISCADPRVIPEHYLSLSPGDAVIFRNVAGHPQTAFKDILTLDQFLKFKEVMVVHHTDCGSTYFDDGAVERDLRDRGVGEKEVAMVRGMGVVEGFGTRDDKRVSVGESVVEDVRWLKGQEVVRRELRDGVRGFVFDTKTGGLEEVNC